MSKAERPSNVAADVAALLRRHGPTELGRLLGVSARAVELWAAGERSPRPKHLLTIAAMLGQPLAGARGTRGGQAAAQRASKRPGKAPDPVPSAPAAALEAPRLPAGPGSDEIDPRAVARETVRTLQRALEGLEEDEGATARERATLGTALIAATRLHARLCGELEVTMASIVRSSAWGRILRAFETVFERHPEAKAALAEFAQELQELGS